MKPRLAIVSSNLNVDGIECLYWNSLSSLAAYDIVVFLAELDWIPRSSWAGSNEVRGRKIITPRIYFESQSHWTTELSVIGKRDRLIIILPLSNEEFATVANDGIPTYHHAIDLFTSAIRILHSRKEGGSPEIAKTILNDSITALYGENLSALAYEYVFPEGQPVLLTGGSNLAVATLLSKEEAKVLIMPKPKLTTKDDIEAVVRFAKESYTAIFGVYEVESAPDWLTDDLKLKSDLELQLLISEQAKSIEASMKALSELKKQRFQLSKYYNLLTANGKILEKAVKLSLMSLGIEAKSYKKEAIEIDCIFDSGSTLHVIEMEGKDDGPVTVKKLQQLQSRVHELMVEFQDHDFKLIMIGNGFRKQDLACRPLGFHEDVIKQSKKFGIALIESREIYNAVNKLDSENYDVDLKERIKQWFLDLAPGINRFAINSGSNESLV